MSIRLPTGLHQTEPKAVCRKVEQKELRRHLGRYKETTGGREKHTEDKGSFREESLTRRVSLTLA